MFTEDALNYPDVAVSRRTDTFIKHPMLGWCRRCTVDQANKRDYQQKMKEKSSHNFTCCRV